MASLALPVIRGCARICVASAVASSSRLGRFQTTSAFRRAQPIPQQASSSSPDSHAQTRKPFETEKKDGDEKSKPLQKPRNEAIKYSVVRLVNRETGALDPPVRLRDILFTLDRKKEYLELVKEKPEPIVKVINTKLQYDRKKLKKAQQAQNRRPDEKEMQLTWGVSKGDLRAKVKKVRDELVDGNRVTLVFAPKKGQLLPAPAEQNAIVEEAVQLLEDVGRESQERAVQKQITVLYLESLRPRKQEHELVWAYGGDEPWVGLKAVETALRKGARVEIAFSLIPPPTKKPQNGETLNQNPPLKVPNLDEIRKQFRWTMEELSTMGKEWRPRDIRRNTFVVYLEGIRA